MRELLGVHGKDILYIGDHIFKDSLKSKKQQGCGLAWGFLSCPGSWASGSKGRVSCGGVRAR